MRCARFAGVMRSSRAVNRTAAPCFRAALLSLLLAAPLALAENGVGLAGPTTDKTVTFFCFGVIAFFAILVIVLSTRPGPPREAQRPAPQLDLRALRPSVAAGSR